MSAIERLFAVRDKHVVVTGGSRGIGRMIATGFVEAGSHVYITARKADACDRAAAEMDALGPGSCVSVPADVSTSTGVDALASAVLEMSDGLLHVLVNNAGATWGAPLAEYPDAAFEKLSNLNVKGTFMLTRALLDALSAAGTADDPSRVINITSIHGILTPEVENYAYSATKAGLIALTRHMAKFVVDRHVNVNAIAPGPFESRAMSFLLGTEEGRQQVASEVPMGRIGRPDDMVGAAIFLASRAGSYVCGETIIVDGGSVNLR
jgi:NAD(P)-dependent dehydrogenase (short-subunit alcohol dehydrogenase family)